MSTDARTIRQYAELARCGHLNEFDLSSLSAANSSFVSALLELNQRVGGPVSKALERLANVIASRDQRGNELELAVAAPKSSAKLVLSLPILVFLGAGIAGIPIFKVLVEPSIVWLSLALGLLLFWVGNRWTNRIIMRAQPSNFDSGREFDLLGVVIQAGIPLTAAKEYVELSGINELQEISETSGIALNALIRERADTARLEQFNADRLKIQKASIAVLWPLGLTVLPAFVLIAVVPIGAALIQSQTN